MRQLRGLNLAVLLWLVGTGLAGGATRFDPSLRFRRMETTHFVVYFHQGESASAARLSRIAEETWEALRMSFGGRMPARTHVVLADQSDSANGWATPLPYNTIVLTATWPPGFESIGHADDWLRLVFTHEFVHIVHLDRTQGYARVVKGLFGRVPAAFPNLFEPTWEVEGLATYFESAITGQGRLHANDFRAIEREPARVGETFPLSRANGGLIAWPGGSAPYVYGLGFHEYLADRYGRDALRTLADHTAGRLPYTGARAYRRVYGQSLGALWDGYQSGLKAGAANRRQGPFTRRLTHDGFVTLGPRFAPDSCESCGSELIYASRTPHEFPSLKSVPAAGGQPRTLTRRYLGSTSWVGPDRIVFDQQEFARNVGIYSDLFVLDRRSGHVRRLTRHARLRDPDVAADGRTIAAVREARGTRELVTASIQDDGTLGAIEPVLAELGTQYATPRWSPDGRTLAVERHRPGTGSEIVLVDAATRQVRTLARGATRAVTPAWRPDGKAVLAAVDSEEGPFNVFEYELGPDAVGRQLTSFPGGATWPAVSADGRTLVFVGYTRDGSDLFSQAYRPLTLVPDQHLDGRDADEGVGRPGGRHARVEESGAAVTASADASQELGAPPYSPWPTIAPRAWMPLAFSDGDQVQVGVTSTAADVLGYHVVSAAMLWRASAPAAIGIPPRAKPDWSVGYTYDRWRPRWFATLSDQTSFLRGASAFDARPSTLEEQTVEGGVLVPFRRVRRTQRLLLSTLRARSTLTRSDRVERFTRVAARAGWSLHTAQIYGYSISPVDGVAAGATAELAGNGFDGITDAATVATDARIYLKGPLPHHVLAARLAAGASTGPRGIGRTFRLGGAGPNTDVLDFGRGAISLLRGFPLDAFAGRRVAVANVEYRLPISRIEQGVGTWPAFLRTIHGAAFLDAGHAWSDGFRMADLKTSAGLEVSADVVLGYALPLTLTVGGAYGHDGAGRVPKGSTAYVRIGRAF